MTPTEKRETLQYIADMLTGLRKMAVAARQPDLVYTIEMALQEAEAQRDKIKAN